MKPTAIICLEGSEPTQAAIAARGYRLKPVADFDAVKAAVRSDSVHLVAVDDRCVSRIRLRELTASFPNLPVLYLRAGPDA